MTNKRNRNKAKTGQSPPTPAPAKKKIDRSSSPSGSVCPQEDYYLIACINCNQTFIYTLTNEDNNTNHCFGQIFAHKDSKSFACNLNCSFKKPTDFCPYSTPKLTVNTSMEMMDTKSISSENTISSQAISPTSTTQNSFHNITLNVAHAASNVTLNLDTNTDDLTTNANTNNTNEQDSSDIDI
ncbi:10708_t:CDS:1, partial [Entrophospora sp. SA101]